MALQASHIRFALELKERMGVNDLKEYVSGSVYPDSRYVTGIDRRLAHPVFEEFEYGDSDFRKGWYTHLALDLAQGNIMEEILGMSFSEIAAGNSVWIAFSAAKMIQDMFDFEKVDFEAIKEGVLVTQIPNSEDTQKLKEHYELTVGMYASKKKLGIEDYEGLWLDMGIGEELWKKMREEFAKLQKDDEVRKKIEGTHDRILKELEDCELRDLVKRCI
ncbi:MAG: hypothetical protein OEV93_00135 [Candidatus Moranbacteria bacterium]|nr:hypothetical protein [Candidatus Moranbacteria bacterium]